MKMKSVILCAGFFLSIEAAQNKNSLVERYTQKSGQLYLKRSRSGSIFISASCDAGTYLATFGKREVDNEKARILYLELQEAYQKQLPEKRRKPSDSEVIWV